jgi:diguanylate cyclase (GGDEF)-like protein
LSKFAEILSREIKNKNIVARIGGDEFVVVFRTRNPKEVDFVCNTITEEVLKYNNNSKYTIEYSYGISINNPYEPLDKDKLIEQADKKMYENKTSRKENT